MGRGRTWAKIDAGWYRDPVLVACASVEPAAMWAWPVLIGMAMEQSHATENPDGVIDTSVVLLAQILGIDTDQVQAALTVLEDGEMLSVTSGKARSIRVELVAFTRWNAPRYSNAKRVADSRENKKLREHATQSDKNTAEQSFAGVLPSNETVAKVSETEIEIEKEKTNILSDKNTDEKHVKKVFEHWAEKTWSGRGRKPMLDKNRRSKIRARLAEGFTSDDLCTAIDGFAADPFYNGDQDGKAKLELKWRLRDAAEVENGIERAATASAILAPTSDQPRGRQL